MQITYLPQAIDRPFDIARHGDVLVLNGDAIDLSVLGPGDETAGRLHELIPHPTQRDENGVLHVSVIRPVDHGAREIETAELPNSDGIVSGTVPKVVTAAEKAERRAAEVALAIKAEAKRRIESIAPLWRQINAMREGDTALFDKIDAIRAASDKLEAMDPIPDDITDDQWWP